MLFAARLPTRNDDLMRMLAARNSPLESSLASSVNFSNMAADASLLSNRVQPQGAALDTATLQFLRNREQQTSQRLLMLQQQLQQQPRDEPTTSPKASSEE